MAPCRHVELGRRFRSAGQFAAVGTLARVIYCVLEALNNVAKYAEATRVEVSLAQIDGHLRFAVDDDGTGFDTRATGYGTGVQGMADRLDAIGGALQVVSRRGEGTTNPRPDPDAEGVTMRDDEEHERARQNAEEAAR